VRVGINGVDEGLNRRAFYFAEVREFLTTEGASIVGRLATAQARAYPELKAQQVEAWREEVRLLKRALSELGADATGWGLLLEFQLHRLRKRIDAVVLMPGVVVALEFKVGASEFSGADRRQAEDYALSLRDFHEYSQSRLVVPVLCSSSANGVAWHGNVTDGVADLFLAGEATLSQVLKRAGSLATASDRQVSVSNFALSAYRPTPSIIQAARDLYAGHKVEDIGRGGAADEVLLAAAGTLTEIVRHARDTRQHIVCFVSGSPGAGKTLLGLDLAICRQGDDTPTALLSGNRPLVHVLVESLAADAASRGGTQKGDERRRVAAAIQNLLDYLKEHVSGALPPENVLVFEEAQRAWDAETGLKLMGRATSEPQLFLDILSRLDWCCLVCLVGQGQEINRGEGGLPLWGQALMAPESAHIDWQVWSSQRALDGEKDLPGLALPTPWIQAERWHGTADLDLGEPVRHHRNPLFADWVAALLGGDLGAAAVLASEMPLPPLLVARSLTQAKAWLRDHLRGGRTVGLLASSGAVRLVAEGVPPTPRSNDLDAIGHWFLKPPEDYRSAGALETPLSEYGSQGLELDYVGLCWGNDLIWSDGWVPRKMSAPRWHSIKSAESRAFRVNSYRVLLTRARAGTVVYVPQGSNDDPTRAPAEFEGISSALLVAGGVVLEPGI
jgi:hypothetical protein